jgi:hypothetical protein
MPPKAIPPSVQAPQPAWRARGSRAQTSRARLADSPPASAPRRTRCDLAQSLPVQREPANDRPRLEDRAQGASSEGTARPRRASFEQALREQPLAPPANLLLSHVRDGLDANPPCQDILTNAAVSRLPDRQAAIVASLCPDACAVRHYWAVATEAIVSIGFSGLLATVQGLAEGAASGAGLHPPAALVGLNRAVRPRPQSTTWLGGNLRLYLMVR